MKATPLQVIAAALGLLKKVSSTEIIKNDVSSKEDFRVMQDYHPDEPSPGFDAAAGNNGNDTRWEEQHLKQNRMSIANMTCDFFEQPLNHFHVPQEQSPSYQQRYCVYNGFINEKNRTKVPIFFYTGMCHSL